MTTIRATAPGKLVVAGEYAVLLPGEPCLSLAVDRRLIVESRPAPRWSVRSADASWSEGAPVPEPLSFVCAAIDAIRARFKLDPRSLETSDELRSGARKLGLGGSGAAAVATIFALGEGTGAKREQLWSLADAVHRAVQGGQGSGADVATSVHGGVVRYTREPLSAQAIALHPRVRPVLVWTGASAKTTSRLERWKAFLRDDPKAVAAFAGVSRAAVDRLQGGLISGDFEQIRGAMAGARAALRGLEEGLGVVLETDALRLAADTAWAAGACGKLSGAGGGDCAIVLADGDDGVARVLEALSRAGLEAFPIRVAVEGVRVERVA